jgi:hypothetical protein
LKNQLLALNNKYPRLIIIFNILLLTVLLVISVTKIGNNHSDFGDYYNASKLFSEKKDVYKIKLIQQLKEEINPKDLFKPETIEKLMVLKGNVGTYIYPPLFAFLLIPLTALSFKTASILFVLFNYFCFLGSIYLLWKMIDSEFFKLSLFVTLLANFKFLENHINNNQVAFLLIFLSLFAVHTKKDILTGILLSLAIVIKLTPGIFVLYLLYKKRYIAVLYTIAFFFAFLFLPSLYDHSYHLTLLKEWNELVLQSAMKTPLFRAWKNNQSLIATLAKYFLFGADPENQPKYGMPFVTLSETFVKGLYYTLSLGIVSTLFLSMYRKHKDFAILSLLFILSVVFSGVSWIHSFSFLFFPVFYMSIIVFSKPVDKITVTLFTIYILTMVFGHKLFLGSMFESFTLMYSMYLYTSLLLYFIVWRTDIFSNTDEQDLITNVTQSI